jgi:hypothetical protein
MNVKRCLVAGFAVFVLTRVLDYVIHGVILMPAYESLKSLWRPDMESLMWLMHVVGFIWSFLFAYIYTKGYEGKGIMEGVRYGLIIGLFTNIPAAYGTYAMIAIPHSMALQWLIYGLIECILAGIAVALIYKPASPAAA